ncbi:MAG: hypothetical protein ACJAUL_002789, partial [Paraglaciecola sp.]
MSYPASPTKYKLEDERKPRKTLILLSFTGFFD